MIVYLNLNDMILLNRNVIIRTFNILLKSNSGRNIATFKEMIIIEVFLFSKILNLNKNHDTIQLLLSIAIV